MQHAGINNIWVVALAGLRCNTHGASQCSSLRSWALSNSACADACYADLKLICDLQDKLEGLVDKLIREIIPDLLDDIPGVIIRSLSVTGIKVIWTGGGQHMHSRHALCISGGCASPWSCGRVPVITLRWQQGAPHVDLCHNLGVLLGGHPALTAPCTSGSVAHSATTAHSCNPAIT